MRTLLAVFIPALLALSPLPAGQLDVAVIQFPEEKTPEELNAAFSGQSLAEITNSNRTMTKEAYLKGGYVLFTQSLPVGRGTGFKSSTRIKDARADVDGWLGGGDLDVTITLMEGVEAGLRSFQKTNYRGRGPLATGSPRVLSMKQVKGKAPSVVKGKTKIDRYMYTTVVVAQYTP